MFWCETLIRFFFKFTFYFLTKVNQFLIITISLSDFSKWLFVLLYIHKDHFTFDFYAVLTSKFHVQNRFYSVLNTQKRITAVKCNKANTFAFLSQDNRSLYSRVYRRPRNALVILFFFFNNDNDGSNNSSADAVVPFSVSWARWLSERRGCFALCQAGLPQENGGSKYFTSWDFAEICTFVPLPDSSGWYDLRTFLF